MSTSGVTTFEMNRDSIIQSALRKAGAVSEGQTPTPTAITDASTALNAMLKTFEVEGMPLWAIKETTFPLTSTRQYNIGIGATINTPAPLKIIQATLLDTSVPPDQQNILPMNIYTHYDYNLLTTQDSAGYPIHLMYEPVLPNGSINIWPTPDAYSIANRVIRIVYQRPFEDFVASTDTPDFPSYWSEALIYGLAWRIAPEYGVPILDQKNLAETAKYFLEKALSFGTEEGSLSIQPNWTYTGY